MMNIIYLYDEQEYIASKRYIFLYEFGGQHYKTYLWKSKRKWIEIKKILFIHWKQ